MATPKVTPSCIVMILIHVIIIIIITITIIVIRWMSDHAHLQLRWPARQDVSACHGASAKLVYCCCCYNWQVTEVGICRHSQLHAV